MLDGMRIGMWTLSPCMNEPYITNRIASYDVDKLMFNVGRRNTTIKARLRKEHISMID